MTREVASFLWFSVNGLLLLLAGIIDKETGLIPNKVTYGGAAFGLAYYGLKQLDMLPPALLGGLVGFGTILFIRLIYPKSIGMGDAKLLGYIGIITGPGQALLVLFLAAVFGLISNIHLFVRRGKQALTTRVPFGPFIAVAGWIVFLWGDTLIFWWTNLFV